MSQIVFVAACLGAGLVLEWLFSRGRRKLRHAWAYRWLNNIGLAAISHGVAIVVAGWLLWLFATHLQEQRLALFPLFQGLPFMVALLMIWVVTEALDYAMHRLVHAVPLLWRLHSVHHSDVDVDASTSFRHHPLEIALSLPPALLAAWLLSPPPEVLLTMQILRGLVAVFSHCNVALPAGFDRRLSYLLVTPGFHRVHHSAELPFTNSNFGTVVPWFDYLFGTVRRRDERLEKFRLGLEHARSRKGHRLDQLLLQPVQMSKQDG